MHVEGESANIYRYLILVFLINVELANRQNSLKIEHHICLGMSALKKYWIEIYFQKSVGFQ